MFFFFLFILVFRILCVYNDLDEGPQGQDLFIIIIQKKTCKVRCTRLLFFYFISCQYNTRTHWIYGRKNKKFRFHLFYLAYLKSFHWYSYNNVVELNCRLQSVTVLVSFCQNDQMIRLFSFSFWFVTKNLLFGSLFRMNSTTKIQSSSSEKTRRKKRNHSKTIQAKQF